METIGNSIESARINHRRNGPWHERDRRVPGKGPNILGGIADREKARTRPLEAVIRLSGPAWVSETPVNGCFGQNRLIPATAATIEGLLLQLLVSFEFHVRVQRESRLEIMVGRIQRLQRRVPSSR